MKVGDLVRSLITEEVHGIIVEAYDTPKGQWKVYWWGFDDGTAVQLCHESHMEVIGESGRSGKS